MSVYLKIDIRGRRGNEGRLLVSMSESKALSYRLKGPSDLDLSLQNIGLSIQSLPAFLTHGWVEATARIIEAVEKTGCEVEVIHRSPEVEAPADLNHECSPGDATPDTVCVLAIGAVDGRPAMAAFQAAGWQAARLRATEELAFNSLWHATRAWTEEHGGDPDEVTPADAAKYAHRVGCLIDVKHILQSRSPIQVVPLP